MTSEHLEKPISGKTAINKEVVKELLFVINPISGGVDKEHLNEYINQFCEKNHFRPILYKTTGEDDLGRIHHLKDKHNPDAIIAIGGDGTVNLVGEALTGTDIPLGIIPKGSANGLAKELGIPEDEADAFNILKRFNQRKIDTLIINNQRAFHISDIGFNAHIIKRFNISKKRGFLNYAQLFVRDFFRYKFSDYRIETPDGSFEGKAFMIIITNAKRFGNNIIINPEGKMDDGKMEIGILKEFPKLQFFRIAYRLLNDTINHSKFYKIIASDKATIYNVKSRAFHIDGEPENPVEKVEVEVDPSSLNVLVS